MIELDLPQRVARVGRSRTVRILSPKEFELLRVLAAAKRVMTRDELLQIVWGHDVSVKVDTRTVDQHIARLRQTLGREAATDIVTRVGYGYVVENVTIVGAPAPIVLTLRTALRAVGGHQPEGRVALSALLPKLRRDEVYAVHVVRRPA